MKTKLSDSDFNGMLTTFRRNRIVLCDTLKYVHSLKRNYKTLICVFLELCEALSEVAFVAQVPDARSMFQGILLPYQEIYEVDADSTIEVIREAYGKYKETLPGKTELESEIKSLDDLVVRPLKTCCSRSSDIYTIVKKYKRYENKLASEELSFRAKQSSSRTNVGSDRGRSGSSDTRGNSDKLCLLTKKIGIYKDVLISVIPQFVDLQGELLMLVISQFRNFHGALLDRFDECSEFFLSIFDPKSEKYDKVSSLRLKQSTYVEKFKELSSIALDKFVVNDLIHPQHHPREFDTPASKPTTQATACGSSLPTSDSRKDSPSESLPLTSTGDYAPASPGSNPDKPLCVIALHNYIGEEGDLSFEKGDVIEVVERTDNMNSWWKGRISDRTGLFPANYVSVI